MLLRPPALKEGEARLLNRRAVALKLLTNRKVRWGAVEFLKDPRMDKRALALKLLTNQRLRQGAIELLKDPDVRGTLLQQATQRFRDRRMPRS